LGYLAEKLLNNYIVFILILIELFMVNSVINCLW